jgi:serine/threonine protein kinase
MIWVLGRAKLVNAGVVDIFNRIVPPQLSIAPDPGTLVTGRGPMQAESLGGRCGAEDRGEQSGRFVVSRVTLGYLGPYRLLNIVNTGQTSQIWQAYHDGRQEFCAIKTLLEKFQKDREQTGYLKWEFEVGQKVVHPRIIEVADYGVDRGRPYLSMEWFSAPNLKLRIQQGVDRIAYQLPQIIEQAAEGLAYFHRQGFVHRDIKPDNFLVSDEGNVKLIDFALAHRQRRGLARLLPGRARVQGTRSYMAPEQIRAEAADPRADLYSLACTIYHMMAGNPPYTGTSADELLRKHLRAPPPPLEAVDRNITPEFAQLVRRCMAKDADKRPDSVQDFLNEFRMMRMFKRMPKPPGPVAPPDVPSQKG